MQVKFHLASGDTVSLSGDDKRDAINKFHRLVGKDTVFALDEDVQRRKENAQSAPITPDREAEIRASFPALFN